MAQERPRIGYVFPAGGRQGTTFLVTVGGQFLGSWNGDYQIDVLQAHFSGAGIQATVRKDIRPLNVAGNAGAAGQARPTPEGELPGC